MPDLPDIYVGYFAGLAVSGLWTVTSLLFTSAGKRLGPTVVNTVRLLLAVVLLGVTHWAVDGLLWPEITTEQTLYLALSGFIGLSIGDQALFTAFVDVGPRIAMLIMTTAPLFAAFFGLVFLGEVLHGWSWLGIGMTVGGVAWVVRERPRTLTGQHPPHRARGITLAFIAAGCQAGGLLLSKVGMGHGILPESEHASAQAATFVRMSFALMAMIPLIFVLRRMPGVTSSPAREAPHDATEEARAMARSRQWSRIRIGLLLVVGGSVVGPFLGVWMSLVAADHAPVGVAQTLTSLPPVLLLPFAYFLHREHISSRAIVGAIIAVAGIGVLFFGA